MFTGIVEEVGTVRHVATTASRTRLEVACSTVLERLAVDDRICVAGMRLTVVDRDDHGFACEVAAGELAHTALGTLVRGSRVNLERGATPLTALGGHLVLGHVDATTKLLGLTREGDGARLRLALPRTLARYVALHGLIALDGVSLTVVRLGKTFFEVTLAPAIGLRTTLGALRSGDLVNMEVDIVARYVERIVRVR